MLEIARILGWASATFLLVAGVTWFKFLRRPDLQRLGGGTEAKSGKAERALQILLFALALSAIAATFAVAGLFAT